jgi:AAA+ ATPase superfamily predicted ATPase
MRPSRPKGLFDRTQEWSDLTDVVSDERPGLHIGIVTGRRRQGKSFLLRSLISSTPGMYHQAQELERAQALARFADDTARSRGLPPGSLHFNNWDTAIRTALGYPSSGQESERRVDGARTLILDELPYLLAHSPEIPSVLQGIYDEAAAAALPARCVIVCGSAIAVMTELLSGAKPLRGRAQLNMTVRPFGYRLAAEYWGIGDPQIALHVDAILGGTAGYRPLIEQAPPSTLAELPAWLGRSALNPAHALFHEKDYLLREDPRITDRQLYNSILSAVAEGAHSPTRIGAIVQRDTNRLRHPLDVLTSAGFLERSQDVLRQKRPTYRIADPIIRFGEVITEPYRVLLEQRDAAGAWAAAEDAFRARILGPHFEGMCREWTAINDQEWLEPIGVVGSTVLHDANGRSQHEIDVVALRRGDRAGQPQAKVIVLGEAKSGHRPRTTADLQRLRHIQSILVNSGIDAGEATLAIFGRAGFDDELAAAQATSNRVHLIDLDSLYR